MNRRKIKQKKIFRLVITVTIIVLLIISIVLPKSNFINKSFLKDIPITINKIIMLIMSKYILPNVNIASINTS